MQFYTELKMIFLILDKKGYYDANEGHLDVWLCWFHQLVDSEVVSDKEAIIVKTKPEFDMQKKRNIRQIERDNLDRLRWQDKQKMISGPTPR